MKTLAVTVLTLISATALAQSPMTNNAADPAVSTGRMPNSTTTTTTPGSAYNDSLDPNNINANNPRLRRNDQGINSNSRTSRNTTTSDSFNSLRDSQTNGTGHPALNTSQPGQQDSESSSQNR